MIPLSAIGWKCWQQALEDLEYMAEVALSATTAERLSGTTVCGRAQQRCRHGLPRTSYKRGSPRTRSGT